MKSLIKHFLNFYSILLFSLFVLVNFPSLLSAQKPALRNYTNVDGLPSNEVYMVLQDRTGYVWLATNYGVCRFDGYNFETFTSKDGLPDNTVYELYEDFKGRIWFITSTLKFSYFENNKIHPYEYNDKITELINWIPFIENRSFYMDSLENLYFGVFEKGNFVINRNGEIKKLKNDYLSSKVIGMLRVTDNKFMIFRKTSVSDTIYYKLKNKWNSTINNEIGKLNYANAFIYYSRNNKLYFTQDKGIYIFTESGSEYYSMPDFIISLDEDHDGDIWIGLRNNGALCYKKGDFNKSPFLHILKGLPVSKIYCDNEGGFWFTTTTNGIFYTPSLSILNYTTADGLLGNQIKDILKYSDNQISVCTENTAYNIITNNTISTIKENIPEGEKIEFVQNEFSKRWIGTNRKLYINEAGKTRNLFKYYNIPEEYGRKVYNPTSAYLADSENTYVSYMSKICVINKKKVKFLTPPYTLAGITNICRGSDGKIFFGSKIGPGIIGKDTLEMLFEKYPELRVKTSFVLFNNDENSLWIATKGYGIYILKENKIKKITIQNGLGSNYIKHLFKKENQIWASTSAGISLVAKENPKDTVYKIRIINSTDGLISNEINMICSLGDKIYAATDKGLSFFNPSEIKLDFANKKPVIITRIQINEKDTLLKKTYELPHNIATILISFKYLSFQNAGKHNYLYRLKGLSDQWQLTKSTEIRYTTLPPGEYLFEIKYVSPENIQSEYTNRIAFIIHKPYWETWWFISTIIFTVLLIIYIIFWNRIRNISRQNKLKLQLIEYQSKALNSQINPHFIFNSLNSIQLYVLNNDIVKSNKYLTKFSKLMRSVLENSQESSITLENEINTLTNYIEIEQLRFNNKFEYEIKTDSKLDIKNVRIPTLLIQPFVENAIWHGFMNKEGRGWLSVILSDNESTIKCIIQDNGIGRKKSAEINSRKSETHKSLGAQITQERLNLLNLQFKNKLEIITTDNIDSSGNSDGTKVELIIPKITK